MLKAINTAAPVLAANGWVGEPGIRIVGAILGILLVVAAIRAMFGKRNGK